MPNDAKLGLVAGVGLVLVMAMVFFRKDPATANPPPESSAPAAVKAIGMLPARGPARRIAVKPASQESSPPPTPLPAAPPLVPAPN
jgi:hypothetical protein